MLLSHRNQPIGLLYKSTYSFLYSSNFTFKFVNKITGFNLFTLFYYIIFLDIKLKKRLNFIW